MRITATLSLFIILILSCQKKKQSINLVGHFYDTNSAEIYFLTENKIINYNFLDSTVTSKNLKTDINSITINNFEYKYENNNDSLIIFDYGNFDLKLKKFDYTNFNIQDLNGSEWEIINSTLGENTKGFIRFQENGEVYNYIKERNDTWAKLGSQDFLLGKFFDKFYVYSSFGSYILANYNKKQMLNLDINENNKFEELLFTKSPMKNINSKYFGRWEKLEDTLKRNTFAYLKYLNQSNLNFDSIRKKYSFNKIEFTKDSLYIYSLEKEYVIREEKNSITYSPETNLYFLDDNKEEPSYLKIEYLSNDTLKVQFPEPYLLFTYVREW